MTLSASSMIAKSCCLAPALAEIADIAGFEAGIAGRAGGRSAPSARARPPRARQNAASSAAAIGRRVGVAQHIDMKMLADAACGRPSSIGARRRATRSGGSLRMQTRIAVDVVIGSSPRTRPATGVTAATGSRANRMIRRPMVGVPEADHVPGQRDREEQDQNEIDRAEAAGESAHASSQMRPVIVRPTSAKKTRAAAIGRGGGRRSGLVARRAFEHGRLCRFPACSRI